MILNHIISLLILLFYCYYSIILDSIINHSSKYYLDIIRLNFIILFFWILDIINILDVVLLSLFLFFFLISAANIF